MAACGFTSARRNYATCQELNGMIHVHNHNLQHSLHDVNLYNEHAMQATVLDNLCSDKSSPAVSTHSSATLFGVSWEIIVDFDFLSISLQAQVLHV